MISQAADNVLAFAGETMLEWTVVASEFKINDVRPAVAGRIIARAEAVSAGKSQAVCRSDVFVQIHGEQKLCAAAQGTIARLPVKSSQT